MTKLIIIKSLELTILELNKMQIKVVELNQEIRVGHKQAQG
jgi:hypothetical protein